MSWQAYVDQSLLGSGHVDKAAIFNTEGTSCWATSPDFKLTPQELEDIVAAFKDTTEPKAVWASGIHIAGEKYMTIKAEDKSLYGMKGKEGVMIVKTKQTLLITHCPPTIQANQAATTVEKLGDYLIGTGY